ncbi:aminotransferase [Rhizobium sp. Root1203]|uniref:DegT/DnrJ/EryC1/StrS family aminotransferase n=1 Tax=Rhizobium sp. Root1203 TaxID=1736427 RepID=UPI00070DC64A|nr:DegT/DnrJ/EryC1/StrS aminotransferase family protein [Rhizobium sp. Root1203]KQV19485.1 aminotransferase [Rhizobium sp. Root1203]
MTEPCFAPWPSFTDEEAEAVRDVLLSNKVNYWTGDICRIFEREFAEWTGTHHAIALTNGTVAIDLALNALQIGAGDEVVVTPRTFLASVSSVVNAGATPVFADVELDSGNISARTIEKVLTPRTKAIVCVHLAGWPCDMDPIMDLARERGLKVIEDCAQAHGAVYKGRRVGSIGHVGAWSFCQDKIMTTGGEGGMVTTNDKDLWSRMWSYKDHGKSYDAVYNRPHPPGFRWLHESFGTNWRMLEVQAAIGRIQLRRMDDWSRLRQKNADLLSGALHDLTGDLGPIRIPTLANNLGTDPAGDFASTSLHANYRLYAYLRPENVLPDWNRERILSEVAKQKLPVFQGTCSEVYLEKAFDSTEYRPAERLPNARELGDTSLAFLVHPTLTSEEIGRIGAGVAEILSGASIVADSRLRQLDKLPL